MAWSLLSLFVPVLVSAFTDPHSREKTRVRTLSGTAVLISLGREFDTTLHETIRSALTLPSDSCRSIPCMQLALDCEGTSSIVASFGDWLPSGKCQDATVVILPSKTQFELEKWGIKSRDPLFLHGFRHASEEAKADIHVVRSVVRRRGCLLRWASTELRADRETQNSYL